MSSLSHYGGKTRAISAPLHPSSSSDLDNITGDTRPTELPFHCPVPSRSFSYSSKMSTPAGKWLGFVTAIWVQAIAGNNYTFSNYSHALKSLMSLTQLQLNNLSVAKDIGKAFGLVSGLASDRLPTSAVLLIGSIEGLIGYGAQWLVVSKHIAPLPYWQVRFVSLY